MFNVFSVPRTTAWRRRKAEALRLETEKAKAHGLPSLKKVRLAYSGEASGHAGHAVHD